MTILNDAEDGSTVVTVPALEWPSFLERFGRRHRAWLATIHGVERGFPVTCIRSGALASVTLDARGAQQVVRLILLNGVSLCAPGPRAVRVQRTDGGADCALEIDTADDGFIRLAFRATAMPDELDGVAPSELVITGH